MHGLVPWGASTRTASLPAWPASMLVRRGRPTLCHPCAPLLNASRVTRAHGDTNRSCQQREVYFESTTARNESTRGTLSSIRAMNCASCCFASCLVVKQRGCSVLRRFARTAVGSRSRIRKITDQNIRLCVDSDTDCCRVLDCARLREARVRRGARGTRRSEILYVWELVDS